MMWAEVGKVSSCLQAGTYKSWLCKTCLHILIFCNLSTFCNFRAAFCRRYSPRCPTLKTVPIIIVNSTKVNKQTNKAAVNVLILLIGNTWTATENVLSFLHFQPTSLQLLQPSEIQPLTATVVMITAFSDSCTSTLVYLFSVAACRVTAGICLRIQ